MKKLTLDIESLALETFTIDGAAAHPGTVVGNDAGFVKDTFNLNCPTNYTCPWTRVRVNARRDA